MKNKNSCTPIKIIENIKQALVKVMFINTYRLKYTF